MLLIKCAFPNAHLNMIQFCIVQTFRLLLRITSDIYLIIFVIINFIIQYFTLKYHQHKFNTLIIRFV